MYLKRYFNLHPFICDHNINEMCPRTQREYHVIVANFQLKYLQSSNYFYAK